MFSHLARILPAQPLAEPTLPGWIWGLFIAMVAGAAALGWVIVQLRTSRRRLAQLSVEQESTTAAHRELLERERKQAKTLDSKRSEITELKREMAAQRKKNHASQEEAKGLRKEVRDLTADLNVARRQPRPAFESKPESKPEPAVAAEPVKTEPVPAPPVPREEKKQEVTASSKLEARVAELDAKIEEKQKALEQQKSEARAMRAELKSLRRRVEGLRRIDLISTGKIELLEDKLRVLGRQYYDAISELAALKGEVQPPAPREVVENKPTRDEIVDVAGATDEMDDTDDTDVDNIVVDRAEIDDTDIDDSDIDDSDIDDSDIDDSDIDDSDIDDTDIDDSDIDDSDIDDTDIDDTDIDDTDIDDEDTRRDAVAADDSPADRPTPAAAPGADVTVGEPRSQDANTKPGAAGESVAKTAHAIGKAEPTDTKRSA
jgi:predicted  nucleic acid-binding Zn-ribbon protein